MNEYNDTEKSRLQRILALMLRFQYWILLCLFVAGAVFYYRQPLPEPVELAAKVEQAKAMLTRRTQERDKIANRIHWLEEDKEFIELTVRDKLGRKKEGETILRFQQ